jgi:signal transduction histidine kinase
MSWLDWFRPPRNLLTFYLAGTLAAAVALVWLGWRLLGQERALERTRAQERLETSVDRVAALLQRSLDDLERQASATSVAPPDSAVFVTADRGGVRARPPGRLVFYPIVREVAEAPRDLFRAGEAVEFAGSDPASAITIYRALARSPALPVRAGALVRLGRTLRKTGRFDEALRAYSDLEGLGDTIIEGLPADLIAREARCSVLEEQHRRDQLEREAQSLYRDLASGRWVLRRAAWDFLVAEVRAWAGAGLAPLPGLDAAVALSEAAESLWARWPATLSPAGRVVSFHGGRPVLSAWTMTPERLEAVLAGREYLEAMCRQVAGEARVQIALSDRDGRVMLGQVTGPQAARTAVTTRLPWTLHVSSADPGGDLTAADTRRRMLLAGLAILGVLILASTYFTFRGIRRELAVARLQSEFVSAVSHEFRTPLTSMRQLSEMLSKGRVISEDRRQQYYDVLSRESERLHRLVEGLLNFGRAETGGARYHMEPVELGGLIRAVAAEFEREAESFGVELTLDAAPCGVLGERDLLSLALWNLLDNARKYSPECRTAWVSLSRNGSRVAIAVRDRGIGIPRHDQRRIFGKFVRGEAGTAMGVKGKGIGLAMVQHVARAHGGQVHVQSEVGRGSTFTILLPESVAKDSGIGSRESGAAHDQHTGG